MGEKIIPVGGIVFALMATIIGASIYGLNHDESKVAKYHPAMRVDNAVAMTTNENAAPSKKEETKKVSMPESTKSVLHDTRKPESLPESAGVVKLKPHHLYVKSNQQIKKEFQQKRITERQMYKMREMRERRLKERKFQEMRNKRKEENA